MLTLIIVCALQIGLAIIDAPRYIISLYLWPVGCTRLLRKQVLITRLPHVPDRQTAPGFHSEISAVDRPVKPDRRTQSETGRTREQRDRLLLVQRGTRAIACAAHLVIELSERLFVKFAWQSRRYEVGSRAVNIAALFL